jgi:hypothetical protein
MLGRHNHRCANQGKSRNVRSMIRHLWPSTGSALLPRLHRSNDEHATARTASDRRVPVRGVLPWVEVECILRWMPKSEQIRRIAAMSGIRCSSSSTPSKPLTSATPIRHLGAARLLNIERPHDYLQASSSPVSVSPVECRARSITSLPGQGRRIQTRRPGLLPIRPDH